MTVAGERRIQVESRAEVTSIDVGPLRTAKAWVHALGSTATLVGIALASQPLVTLPLRTGETMLRVGIGALFLICIVRLVHQSLWSLGGREYFEVTPFEVVVRRTCFGVGRVRAFPTRFVTNIRAHERIAPSRRGKRRVLARGIAFDVGGRTVKSTMNLSVPEATFVATTLNDALESSRREAARTYR